MARNPYKVLTRPHTKRADIIRATLPNAYDNCHVYATCSSREEATHLCDLLNLGLEVYAAQDKMAKPKKRPKNVTASKMQKPRGW